MLGQRSPGTLVLVSLLSLVSGLQLAACGSVPPAKTLARDAVSAFDAAPVKTIQGSFVDGVVPVSLKLTVGPEGDASGIGTFEHFPVTYVQGSKSSFVEGTQYWAWERLSDWQVWTGLGSTWVKTNPDWDPATNAFQRGIRATGLVTQRGADAGNVTLGHSARLQGRRIDQLLDGPITYDVAARAPHRLLAVSDGAGRIGNTVLGRTRFSIGYGGAPLQGAPAHGGYVDPTDPSTLPAEYDITKTAAGECQNGGCSDSVTVQNLAGAPVGKSLVTITQEEYPENGSTLGSCQIAIPAIGYKASTTIGCTVRSPQLAAWLAGGGQTVARAVVSNPPYWT